MGKTAADKGKKAVAQTSPKKKRPLTIRQKKLVKELLKGKPARVAMRAAGYSPQSADGCAKQTIEKLGIAELCDRIGLTDEKIAATVLSAMDANKVISATVIRGKPDSIADEQDGMADANSMSKDFIDVPDWQARLKASEISLKVKGHLKEKAEITGDIKITWEAPD